MSEDMGSNVKGQGPYVARPDGALEPAAIAAIDESVGIRLRARRAYMGLSQAELAARMGLSFQQVQKYERGFNRISASRLYQLAIILRVQVSYFFEDLPVDRRQVPVFGIVRSPIPPDSRGGEIGELLTAFRSLSTKAERQSFVRLLKAMKTPEPSH